MVELCVSVDDGHSWETKMPLTLPLQVTSHLMRLDDGRVLLSYGNRSWGSYGVEVRFSDDQGENWGPPVRIAHTLGGDSGYPSTVQLPDGRAITAYYTKLSHDFHYEMRVARWTPGDFSTKGKFVGT